MENNSMNIRGLCGSSRIDEFGEYYSPNIAFGEGGIDHPSYITRQQLHLGATTAGASGTSCRTAFPSNVRIRNVVAAVQAAGTTSGAAAGYTIQTGTTSVGAIVLSTNGINFVGSSGDLNITVNNGGTIGNILNFVSGADATVVVRLTCETYLDPQATWTGQN